MYTDEERDALRADAVLLAREVLRARAGDGLEALCRAACEEWAELQAALARLSEMAPKGWGLARGWPRILGWDDVRRLRGFVERLPEFEALVRALGQLEPPERSAGSTVLERLGRAIRRRVPPRERHPGSPSALQVETLGRGDELDRMLASETVLLAHPSLRKLWHARRAERALLTYHAPDEPLRVEPVLQTFDHGGTSLHERAHQGPILLAVDTSGSMSGARGATAKAIALQAVLLAQQTGRACWLYLFSGPGDVLELECRPEPAALPELLEALGVSFHGGTDVLEPLRQALDGLRRRGWHGADVLLVTDGEFAAPVALRSQLSDARRDFGTRVHGVLVGARETAALRECCDEVHSFEVWSRAGLSGLG